MSLSLLRRIIDALGFSAPARPGAEPPQPLPQGLRIYAIGDIHGFTDLLDRMVGRIEADLAHRRPDQALAVFLGDYIDRGPDSAGVIDRLVRRDVPIPFETLRGNHEDLMLKALADPGAMADWYGTGAAETLRSYGVDPDRPGPGPGKGLGRLRKQLLDRLPAAHRDFLERTRLSYGAGDYAFVHAGARPGIPLDRQDPADLMWIRQECYGSTYDFGKVLVHGHTPRRRPENHARRINVDTGAFKWGVLSCAVLEGTTRRFLSTRD